MAYTPTVYVDGSAPALSAANLNKSETAIAAAVPMASGTATLAAGTVTVANTNITTSSLIRLTTISPGGTVGHPYVSARTAGTGFTITSTSGTDTSSVFWEIVTY